MGRLLEEGGKGQQRPEDGLEVKTFNGLDQPAFEGTINGVVEVAEEEANIEGQLTVIRKRWEDRKFVLSRELIGNTSSHKLTVINQIDKLHEEVESDDMIIDSMLNSRKSDFFRPDLETMKGRYFFSNTFLLN